MKTQREGSVARWAKCLLVLAALLLSLLGSNAADPSPARVTFSCADDNDLYAALRSYKYPRFDSPSDAIHNAADGSAVLLLADRYPDQTVYVEPAVFAAAVKKKLHLYIEYPSELPGMEVAMPLTATWERIVVASDKYGAPLPQGRILALHDCHFQPVKGSPSADLVLARVAGYDRAIYGLPEKKVFPILFSLPEQNLIVGTTKLSGFVTGRYAPSSDWLLVWQKILAELVPAAPPKLTVQPVVTPSFTESAELPTGFERNAFDQAARWFSHAKLLVNTGDMTTFGIALREGLSTTTPPDTEDPEGNGASGILEGYDSRIMFDGSQSRRLPLRADCNAESAMVLALDALLNPKNKCAPIASNLLDFVYLNSDICAGHRADPADPAYGLIGWGAIDPAWQVANYGDDNARTLLATIASGTALNCYRWDKFVMRGLLANLRTTGKQGFRDDRIDMPALETNGWKFYRDSDVVNYSPHFDSYLWACFLWAWNQTQYPPFLDKATNAIAMTMKAYPGQWRWQNNIERARMLLPLAWLVRVQDTPEHREWLNHVASDLLLDQQQCGSIRERLGGAQGGFFHPPTRNEDYGTGESSLLQSDGDPVSDQLYTTGFALLGLHEAVGATDDAKLRHAEDKLAEFLCRIQTRSETVSWLNGTWFRAFDDKRWEAWASSADSGWGAWSIESGWGQAWTTETLGLRAKKTTLWEFTKSSGARFFIDTMRKEMEME